MTEDTGHVPVTYDNCGQVRGPFYHGTKSLLKPGDELVAGYGSNFHDGRISNNIYFSAVVETAAWGAELASALAGSADRGQLRVVNELENWQGHDPQVLKEMLDRLTTLREQGLDVIED